jgi:hypothetical protein
LRPTKLREGFDFGSLAGAFATKAVAVDAADSVGGKFAHEWLKDPRRGRTMLGKWRPISDYVEPSWDDVGDICPLLFWRRRDGAAFGYMRDGELFDAKWVYIGDSSKVTHFLEVPAPDQM